MFWTECEDLSMSEGAIAARSCLVMIGISWIFMNPEYEGAFLACYNKVTRSDLDFCYSQYFRGHYGFKMLLVHQHNRMVCSL